MGKIIFKLNHAQCLPYHTKRFKILSKLKQQCKKYVVSTFGPPFLIKYFH